MKHRTFFQFYNHKVIFLIIIALSLMWGSSTISSSFVLAEEISARITQELITLKNSEKRWIEVDLSTQRLTAWEGDKPIRTVIVSTGKQETPTRSGVFAIQSKHRIERMRGADYDISDVPYAMYYHGGYAIHGAYWHNHFGTPISHGCINVAVDHAEWLFNWTSLETPVVIHN
jgi:lipoprotein-anchoring transpeptidase ErfK/SrfK